METEKVLAKGVVERIGQDQPNLRFQCENGTHEDKALVTNHTEAVELICKKLTSCQCGVLKSLDEVDAIGHRVVHGGETFTSSVLINNDVKTIIESCADLAPLHNPPNLDGITACEAAIKEVPNIAVFDTAFHQSMPAESYLYALPYEMYEKHGIRKYGFHGTSHKFVAQATAEYLGKPLEELNLITCHLGNGGSLAAIKNGKVIDTSMGMTPLAGLVMGTRCGDIDPGVLIYMMRKGQTVDQIDSLLNKQSGLLGIGRIGSSDMRDLRTAAAEGRGQADRAREMFIHRLAFYIGGYNTLIGGADTIVLTGGIGENCPDLRELLIERLSAFDIRIEKDANESYGEKCTISTPDSGIKIIVMPTDEELMIARETEQVLLASK